MTPRKMFEDAIGRLGGLTTEDSRKVADYYLQENLASVDIHGGSYRVTHGALMDRGILQRARDIVRSKESGTNFA